MICFEDVFADVLASAWGAESLEDVLQILGPRFMSENGDDQFLKQLVDEFSPMVDMLASTLGAIPYDNAL